MGASSFITSYDQRSHSRIILTGHPHRGLLLLLLSSSSSPLCRVYTYIPETNYVPREYGVAAILLLLFMVLISSVSVLNLLYF